MERDDSDTAATAATAATATTTVTDTAKATATNAMLAATALAALMVAEPPVGVSTGQSMNLRGALAQAESTVPDVADALSRLVTTAPVAVPIIASATHMCVRRMRKQLQTPTKGEEQDEDIDVSPVIEEHEVLSPFVLPKQEVGSVPSDGDAAPGVESVHPRTDEDAVQPAVSDVSRSTPQHCQNAFSDSVFQVSPIKQDSICQPIPASAAEC